MIDGTGAARYLADLRVEDDRIAAIGPSLPAAGATVIDASGLVVAPGFIDVHTHDDQIVLAAPAMLPKVSQGVTTVVVGNCGISLAPLVRERRPAAAQPAGRQRQLCPPHDGGVCQGGGGGASRRERRGARRSFDAAYCDDERPLPACHARRAAGHGRLAAGSPDGRRHRPQLRRVLRHRRRGRHRRAVAACHGRRRSGRRVYDAYPRRDGPRARFARRSLCHRAARQAAGRGLASQVRGAAQLGTDRRDARALRRGQEDRRRSGSTAIRTSRVRPCCARTWSTASSTSSSRGRSRIRRCRRGIWPTSPPNGTARSRKRVGACSRAAHATSRCARTTCNGCCNTRRR